MAADLVPLLRAAFADGHDTANWTRDDFLHGFGTLHGALLYAALFAPTFIEVEGCIFLAEFAQPPGEELAGKIRAARTQSASALAQFLDSCNWLEVPYLFADRRGSDEEVDTLAHAIADAWRLRLRGCYPNRQFEVRVLPASETGGTIGVGFIELL